MSNELRQRAQLFGTYVCAEIKGAIVTQGYGQGDVADAIGRQRANLSRWLNAKPVIPVEVAHEVCEHIGMSLKTLVDRAEQRVIDELGPWPPIVVDPSRMSEEEKVQYVLNKLKSGDQTLAASIDPYKEYEKEGGDGR